MLKWKNFTLVTTVMIVLFAGQFGYWYGHFDNRDISTTMLLVAIVPTCLLLTWVIQHMAKWFIHIRER